MAFDSGIPKIDQLLTNPAEPPLSEGAKEPAVGIVHDLINRFDPSLRKLRSFLPRQWRRTKRAPLPDAKEYLAYSSMTTALVGAFQQSCGLPQTGNVDHATAFALLAAEKGKALVTPAELIFAHKLKYSHFLKALVLTGGKECSFDFTKMNRNTDRAGLSLGVLQWAQKPGRLAELIELMRASSPVIAGMKVMDVIFGGEAELDRVIAHLKLGKDGLKADGSSIDPKLEFARPPMVLRKYWPACFEILVAAPFAQAYMVDLAIKTYRKLYDASYPDYPGDPANLTGRNLKGYAPKLKSERAVIFALDMINQHGGAVRTYYNEIVTTQPDATEQQVLEGLRDRAVQSWSEARDAAEDARRHNYFLDTPNLSSELVFDPT